MKAFAKLLAQCGQLVQASFDLFERIGTRFSNVFVPQFDHHLRQPANRPNEMYRVIFAGR